MNLRAKLDWLRIVHLGILTWHVAGRLKHIWLLMFNWLSKSLNFSHFGIMKNITSGWKYISHTASSSSSSLSSFWPPSINHVIREMPHSHKRIQLQNCKIDRNPTGSSHGKQLEPKRLTLTLIYPSHSQGLGSIWAIKTAIKTAGTLEYLQFTVFICVFMHNPLSFYQLKRQDNILSALMGPVKLNVA